MAIITIEGQGFYTSFPAGFIQGRINADTNGRYQLSTYTLTWFGKDLVYDAQYSVPVGGTLTSISLLYPSGKLVWSSTGSIKMTPSLALDPTAIPFAMADADDEPDIYNGTFEADTFIFRGNNTTVNAGAGEDTIALNGNFAEFSFSDIDLNSSSLTMTALSVGYVIRLNSVEIFSFGDQTKTFSEVASLVIPTYELVADAAFVDEASVATFTLKTTNLEPGTSVTYALSGITKSDIVGGLLSGNTIIDTNGSATITIPISADGVTEGSEILTLTVGDSSVSVTVNDTSFGPPSTETNTVTIIVNEGVAGPLPLLLENLIEKKTSSGADIISHTLTYAGNSYTYEELDEFITTVLRNDNFTAEFQAEISDLSDNMPAISYQDLILLVGQSNISTTLINIAGADGYFVT